MTNLPNNADVQASVRGAIAAPVTPLHEQVVKMVNDLIAQQMQQYGITFGNVTGQDGGAVRVLIDGEDDPRQVGFPRHVGVQYANGARVAIGTTTTGEKFVMGPVNDGTGQNAEAVVGSQNLQDGSVQNNHIAPSAVDTPQLRDNGVTNAKLASGAVDTPQLKDNSVNGAKIAGGAVDTAQLNSNAVTNAKIATNAVDTPQLAGGSVTGAKIANGAVDTAQLANGSVTSAKLAGNMLSNYVLVADYDNMQRVMSGAVLTVDSRGRVTLPTFNRL